MRTTKPMRRKHIFYGNVVFYNPCNQTSPGKEQPEWWSVQGNGIILSREFSSLNLMVCRRVIQALLVMCTLCGIAEETWEVSTLVLIVWETSNVAEIEGLQQGIEMFKENHWMLIIIEGESQVIIQMDTKLQNGTHSSNMGHSWRLEGSMEKLKGVLAEALTTTFSHFWR